MRILNRALVVNCRHLSSTAETFECEKHLYHAKTKHRNRYRSRLKKKLRPLKKLFKKLSAINKAFSNSFHRSFLLGTFTAQMSSFELKQIQIKLGF